MCARLRNLRAANSCMWSETLIHAKASLCFPWLLLSPVPAALGTPRNLSFLLQAAAWTCLGGIGPGSACRRGRPRPAYSGLISSWLPAPPPPASINIILRGFGHSLFYLMLPLYSGGLGVPSHTCPLPCLPLSPEPRLSGWRISYSNPWMGFRAGRSWSWLSVGTWVDCFGLQVSVSCRHSAVYCPASWVSGTQ